MYNQNLRLKFGSAPAQLLSIGEQAEKSLVKRMSVLKNQFDSSNMVNTKSQLSNHLSKQAMQGTVSSISWSKWEDKSKSVDPTASKSGRNYESPLKKVNNIRYDEETEESTDDDDAIVVGKNRGSKLKMKTTRETMSSRDTERVSNSSSNMEIEKFY